MNKSILKIILYLSIFVGIVSSLLTIVPYIGEFVFWALITVSAPLVMLVMVRMNILWIETVKQSVVLGALIGFVSFIIFSAIYIPIIIALDKYFEYSANYGVSMFLTNANFGLIAMLAIFMGVLSATINAFSGFATYYLLEFSKTLQNPKENNDDTHFNL